MKALIYGAGKIARGFIAQLLSNSGYELVFVDINRELVTLLNEIGTYTVHILGNKDLDSEISKYHAITLDDTDAIIKEMEDVQLVFTSVGGKNLKSLGSVIATVWKESKHKRSPINFITCENWKQAGEELHTAILNELPIEERKSFARLAGVSEGVIMRISTQPSPELLEKEPLGEWVQNFWELPINAETFKGELPKIQGMELIDHFDHFLEQKLYTNNTSNALIAYYGHLLGYRVVAESANSIEMQPLLDEIYDEINRTLLAQYHVDIDKQMKLAKMARDKYSDWEIVDEISRHAKDPIRKLGPEDRLIAPAKMAMNHGIEPNAMVIAIASALYYENDDDESAVELKKIRKEKGVPFILETICKLQLKDPLAILVLEKISQWRKEGFLHE